MSAIQCSWCSTWPFEAPIVRGRVKIPILVLKQPRVTLEKQCTWSLICLEELLVACSMSKTRVTRERLAASRVDAAESVIFGEFLMLFDISFAFPLVSALSSTAK